VTRLRRRGLPARISRDAGGYLCNALLYHSLEIARRSSLPSRTGFIHLPANLVGERRPSLEPRITGRLTWSDVVEGGLEILSATIGRRPIPIAQGNHRTRANRAGTNCGPCPVSTPRPSPSAEA
jgi:pyroglutamyl-peptidase